jgi:hypothetical protein
MPRPAVVLILSSILGCGAANLATAHDDASDDSAKPWALRPVQRPNVPVAQPGDDVRNSIDAFIAAELHKAQLTPAAEADRRTLIRRLTFDLTGLPPTPEEVAAFTADSRPDAYDRLVDRLLASPHYGERWGRHWLDVVRFAESHGYERDDPKPNAWKYRDYVVDSLNRDKPYDRFLTEQLAGDELPDASAETKVATGLHRLGLIDDEPADPVMDRYDQLDDMVKTVGTTFLGVTLHCARCHDHKFDPIKQADYYRFVSFFEPTKPYVRDSIESISLPLADRAELERHRVLSEAVERQLGALKQRLSEIGGNDAKLKASIEAQIAVLEKNKPGGIAYALGLTDASPNPPATKIRVRGDAHKPGDEVAPGFIKAIDDRTPSIIPAPAATTTGRRSALARWITSPDQPLTPRVIVNRLWHHHFGRGIVGTPSDFGAMGEAATHPELLDWLACELVHSGWSLKHIHRLIVTSAAYRRSNDWNDTAGESDPHNTLLWRFTPRRLEAEPVRDAILAVTGSLNKQAGGPSVMPPIDKAVLAGQSRPGNGWTVSPPEQQTRRSVYVFVKRTLPLPELEVLDAACTDEPTPKRAVTTTAPQALTMINSEFMHEQASRFVQRLKVECGDDPARQVERAFQLAYTRVPTAEERAASLAFLGEQESLVIRREKAEERAQPRDEAVRAFCLVLLNSNEFLTVD